MIVVELCVFGIYCSLFFVRKVNLLIIYIDYINCVNKLVYIEKVVIICCVLFFDNLRKINDNLYIVYKLI